MSVCPWGYPCNHSLWCTGPHCTCPLQTLEPSVQGPSPKHPPSPSQASPSRHWTSQYKDSLAASGHWTSLHWTPPPAQTPGLDPTIQWLPASDIWWPSLETSSNLFTWGSFLPSTDIWWLLKHVQLASERHASYWNAFLFSIKHGTRILCRFIFYLCLFFWELSIVALPA